MLEDDLQALGGLRATSAYNHLWRYTGERQRINNELALLYGELSIL